jgi:hypothetical protein
MMREQVTEGMSSVESIDTQYRCAGETSAPRSKDLKSLSGAPALSAVRADNQHSKAVAIEPLRRSNDRPHSFSHLIPQHQATS